MSRPRAAITLVLVVAVVAATAYLANRSDERAGLATGTVANPPASATTLPPDDTALTTIPGPTTLESTTSTRSPVTGPAPGEVCPQIGARNEPDPDRPGYRLDLTIDPVAATVSGTQTVEFVPDQAVDRLVFRLWANGPRPASVGTRISVDRVEIVGHGPATTDQPDRTRLDVLLPGPVPAGSTVTTQLDWSIEVGGPVNDRISASDGSMRLGSFVPLLAWQPGGRGWATEPPTSGFAEATTSPVADWSVAIEVPALFEAIGTGQLFAGRWEASALRDFAISVGRFRRVTAVADGGSGPVDVVVAVHDDIDDPDAYVARTVASIEFFAGLYGPYPYPAYRLVLTPGLSGGIEFPTHVMQGPDTSGRTTPHEVAHMWFYGLVGNNQATDPWIDEGLASYAEGRFENTLGVMASRSIPADGRGRAGEPMSYWETRPSSYYRSVYVQTAVAVAELGPPGRVDCALAHLVAEHAHTIVTATEVLDTLDRILGDARPRLASAGITG